MKDAIFVYDPEKSKLLREIRGLGFEEIIEYIEGGAVVEITAHPNQKLHHNQWIYRIKVEEYVYEIPFYQEGEKHILKTLYPSRKATKNYQGKFYDKET